MCEYTLGNTGGNTEQITERAQSGRNEGRGAAKSHEDMKWEAREGSGRSHLVF